VKLKKTISKGKKRVKKKNAQGKGKKSLQKSTQKSKDSLFRTLFNDEARARELCEAASGQNFPEDEKVSLCNLEDSLFNRFNDIGVAIGEQILFLHEHQSTLPINIPYRYLEYIVFIYGTWFVDRKLLFGNILVKIPTPKFFVLYNGEKPLEKTVLKLSDAFEVKGGKLELEVHIIDINYERGHEALEKSPNLKGYAYLIHKIREFQKTGLSRDESIANAIRTCITEGILAEFLKNLNFEEVCNMLNFEYNFEDELAVWKAEGIAEGEARGKAEGIAEGTAKGMSQSAQIIRALKEGVAVYQIAAQFNVTEEQVIELQEALFATA
jgi:hypothetical protein